MTMKPYSVDLDSKSGTATLTINVKRMLNDGAASELLVDRSPAMIARSLLMLAADLDLDETLRYCRALVRQHGL